MNISTGRFTINGMITDSTSSLNNSIGMNNLGMYKTIPVVKPIKPRKPRIRTSPPKRHSLYWTYFAFISEVDGKISEENIVCRLCGQTYRFSGNTTNLKSHLSRHHREEYADLEKRSVSSMSHVSITPATIPRSATEITASDSNSVTASAMAASGHNQNSQVNLGGSGSGNVEITTVYVVPHPETIANAILSWLYLDLMPIHSVTGDGFRRLLMACNPNLEIPISSDISQGVSKLFEDELMKISDEVKDIPTLSVSVEIWSTNETEHYVTVRGFWINENWELRNKVLHTRPLEDKDNYEILATEINNSLNSCNIMLSKVICVVAQACPAIEKAVTHHLGIALIPCLAHTLNTSLKQAMETTTPLGGIVQRLLAQYQEAGASADGTNTNPYGPVRSWSSIFTLLTEMADQQASLAEFMVQNADIGIVKEALLFLQSFKLASDGMCTEKYPPASMLLPLLYRLIHINTDLSNSLAKMLRTRVSTATRTYWEDQDVNKILNTVSIFDPRFKTLPHLNPTQRQEVTQFVHAEVAAMLEQDGDSGLLPEQPVEKTPKSGDGSLMGSLLGGLFDDPGSYSQSNPQTSHRIQEEIDKYSLEQRLNTNCSPLEWWRVHESKYPLLAKVARKYLCVSCTSVPASWVLTEAGETIHHKKAGVEPEYREKLIFLHENLEPLAE